MKKTRAILRVLAAFMAILLMTASGALAASIPARINSSSAKVYNVPSSASKIYVQGGKGLVVSVTGYANGWARVQYKGNTGYTQIRNLNLVNRPKGYTKKSTPVYRQDSTSSSRIGTLSAGSTVYVAGVSGNFYRVQNASGTVTGYVKKGTLATKSQMTTAYNIYKAYLAALSAGSSNSGSSSSGTASGGTTSGGTASGGTASGGTSSGTVSGGSTGTTSAADLIIAEAKKYIGRKYSADANPPSTFNCSVFVNYVFEQFGISMKNTAAEQYADRRYTLVSDISKIKKGDILCFDTTTSDDAVGRICDHTAIYIGNNQFIESSQNANAVQINTLTDWYKGRFMGARRVF